MSRIVLALFALSAFVSSASAQIIYQPVQYQYEAGGTLYYYGGQNPWVHEVAHEINSPSGSWGRANGFAYFSGDARSFVEVTNEPTRVYSDATGTYNAGILGMTPNDARDEAYANADRYFVKRDIAATAIAQPDGSWLVTPHASSTIHIYKSDGTPIAQGPATRTITEPKPLMIIPKDLFQNPTPARKSDKPMASSN